jgi:hypothetical protein
MKQLSGLIVLTACIAVPSFASDVVGYSVQVTGKDSARAVKVTASDSAKAVVAVGKF